MDFSAVVLALGPPIAEHIYAAWRRRRGKIDHQAQSLRELIARDCENKLIRNKLEWDLAALSNT
jgi:hypothetical protein